MDLDDFYNFSALTLHPCSRLKIWRKVVDLCEMVSNSTVHFIISLTFLITD